MRIEIGELHSSSTTTMIYVTHDQVEAMTMADKIVVLERGTIEQVGSPLELYNRPPNRFVAGFIGSPKMNFITGRIAAERGATYHRRPARALSMLSTTAASGRAGRRSPSISAPTPSSTSMPTASAC